MITGSNTYKLRERIYKNMNRLVENYNALKKLLLAQENKYS